MLSDYNNTKKHLIVMVGLPARGKTYISNKLYRYLKWIGYTTQIFNVGDYRRKYHSEYNTKNTFFDHNIKKFNSLRNNISNKVLNTAIEWLQINNNNIAIFDATNTTIEKRSNIKKKCKTHNIELLYIETICDCKETIYENIQMKLKNMTEYQNIEIELGQRLVELKKTGKLLEAQRLESRTRYDLEMLKESGYCSGVENYSRHLSQRQPNSVPYTLMDYFPEDFVLFVDESHMTLPQIRAMYGGDRSRKEVLVEHGFRLPSALDNRPLNFEEFVDSTNQVVFVSATPGPYENQHSLQTVEQLIRPTGLTDPEIEVKGTTDQIDDLLREIKDRIVKSERCLVTTLTKRMAEELSEYLIEMGIKTHYLHSEIKTFERSEILRDLRLGLYDVIVGINLLREGLDLPEVSLVVILDADKEGYLRSHTALIQTIGRAARHIDGKVIMFADKITGSMQKAIDETERRRDKQNDYNNIRGITPRSIRKTIHDITERISDVVSAEIDDKDVVNVDIQNVDKLISDLEKQMKRSSEDLEFEKAAIIRDKIIEIKKLKQQNAETIDIVIK